MTPQQAKVRNWNILRLRGAYQTCSNIAKGMGYDPTLLLDEIETMLLKLGAETEATRKRKYYKEICQ